MKYGGWLNKNKGGVVKGYIMLDNGGTDSPNLIVNDPVNNTRGNFDISGEIARIYGSYQGAASVVLFKCDFQNEKIYGPNTKEIFHRGNTAVPVRDVSRKLWVRRLADPTLTITADDVILHDSSGNTYLAQAVNDTVSIAVSGAGGLDTGAEASSTYYYVWLIYNPTTETLETLLSLSKTAPTMPGGYTYKALVGYVFNNASGNFEEVGIWDGLAFVNYHSGQDLITALAAGGEQEITIAPSLANFSTQAAIITVRGGTNSNVAWKAILRTTGFYEFLSGGKGTAPADPTPPGSQHRVAIRVKNNHGSAQDVYIKATAIGHMAI